MFALISGSLILGGIVVYLHHHPDLIYPIIEAIEKVAEAVDPDGQKD